MKTRKVFLFAALLLGLCILAIRPVSTYWAIRTFHTRMKQGLLRDLPFEKQAEAESVFQRLRERGMTIEDIAEYNQRFRPILEAEKQYFQSTRKRYPVTYPLQELELVRSIANHPKGSPYPK